MLVLSCSSLMQRGCACETGDARWNFLFTSTIQQPKTKNPLLLVGQIFGGHDDHQWMTHPLMILVSY